MVIYGVLIIAFSMMTGLMIGDGLGLVTGLNSNVGGVGFAMLILLVLIDKLLKKSPREKSIGSGILFWKEMYIPVVIAMTASQNVVQAISGGPAALVAGTAATVLGFILVPVFCRRGGEQS